METINTVNFEDLFDFSPEPVDQVASSGATGGGSGGDSKSGEGSNITLSNNSRNIKNHLEEGSSYDAVAGHHSQQHHNAFADFDRVLAGGSYLSNRESSSPKLSVSVPANWSTSGGGGGISSTTPPTASSSADTNKGFTVGSVGQLLNELPEAATAPSVPVVTKSKRGRKPGQKSLRTDMKTKLERSRQSARECRARKKLRYQYLDDLILEREKANELLRQELVKYQKWCHEIDKGRIPDGLTDLIKEFKAEQQQQQQQTPW